LTRAPRQLPSHHPSKRTNPTVRANSELDKTWGNVNGIPRAGPLCLKMDAGTSRRNRRASIGVFLGDDPAGAIGAARSFVVLF